MVTSHLVQTDQYLSLIFGNAALQQNYYIYLFFLFSVPVSCYLELSC